MNYDGVESVIIGDSTGQTVLNLNTLTGILEITTNASANNNVRLARIDLLLGTGVVFNFGVQSDTGGVLMENTSSVEGNIYSNGPVEGQNNNLVKGDIVSAGAMGFVDGSHATGSVYAHTIEDSDIDKDAYYQVIDASTTVDGTKYSGSPDQSIQPLPITDAMVAAWEAEAEAAGVHTSPCPYVIDSDITIGPLKIACDLEVNKNSTTLTLQGNIWVEGNIKIKKPVIRIDPTLGNTSVVIIADNPADRLNSSTIEIENTTVFQGSGAVNSNILVLSQNSSAELGGGVSAINVENGSQGDLLVYAGHGEILLRNSTSLKEVTAWRVRLRNGAKIIYETGLASLLFSGGPSGGFELNSWREIK
jgi:hypothetical protein